MNVTLDLSPKTETYLAREAAFYQKPVGTWTMERFLDFYAKFRESSPGAAQMDQNTFSAFDQHIEGTALPELMQGVLPPVALPDSNPAYASLKGYGKFAGVLSSVDTLLREKQEEIEKEDRR